MLFNKNSCKKRLEDLIKRGIDPKEASDRIAKGCNTHKKQGENDEFEYWRCPCKFYNPAVVYLVQATYAMKQGILPFPGGYLDQPAITMEAINIIQDYIAKKEEHEEKERERKMRQSSKR